MSEPRALPYCSYPSASDVAQHGLQILPASLPLVDFEGARPHRSLRYVAMPASYLTPAEVLRLAEVVGTSFARREPQCRHLRPAKLPSAELREALHADPFGESAFGPWSTERLMYWFIRLLVLTDATSPRSAVEVNTDSLAQSLAVLDDAGDVVGGALNETMPLHAGPPSFRRGDPFLDAVLAFVDPVFALLGAQDAEALKALSVAYPDFRDAHAARKVGHHFMVARSDALPKSDAFELVAATASALPDARPRLHDDRGDQPVDGGVVRGARSHARPLRSVPGTTDRAPERRAAGGHGDEPGRVPLRQGQRQHALRDPPRLEARGGAVSGLVPPTRTPGVGQGDNGSRGRSACSLTRRSGTRRRPVFGALLHRLL
jgi:hypothetical protein